MFPTATAAISCSRKASPRSRHREWSSRPRSARTAQRRKDAKLRSDAETLAQRINGQTLRFTVKVGELDRLYGSITNVDIADKVKQQLQIEVDRRKIELGDPIKRAGVYSVPVRLASGVEARLNVVVEGAADEAASAQPDRPTTPVAAGEARYLAA